MPKTQRMQKFVLNLLYFGCLSVQGKVIVILIEDTLTKLRQYIRQDQVKQFEMILIRPSQHTTSTRQRR